MSEERYIPRADERGRFTRVCNYRGCRELFRTNNERALYHTEECRTSERNARYYEAHKEHMILRVQKRRKRVT